MLLLALLLAAAPQLTADEIVARHVEARGGAARLKAIQSLRLEGKIFFGGGEGAVTAEASQLMKRPDSIRREFSLQGLTGIDGFDGKGKLGSYHGRYPQMLLLNVRTTRAFAAQSRFAFLTLNTSRSRIGSDRW